METLTRTTEVPTMVLIGEAMARNQLLQASIADVVRETFEPLPVFDFDQAIGSVALKAVA